MHLYITESDCKLGVSLNYLTIKQNDEVIQKHPMDDIESISIFGLSPVSTKLVREMIKRKKALHYYSKDGHHFGRISSTDNVSTRKQKMQALASMNDNFNLELGKRIVSAKITNQMSLLKAYDEFDDFSFDNKMALEASIENLKYADNIGQLLGIEGNSARIYFEVLSKIVPADFAFNGRSKRPPKDPFNSMISFGYSLLFKDIIGSIDRHGLNPFFGHIHQDRERHPALVSDLMEEWRAPIIDDSVMKLLKDRVIKKDMFTKGDDGVAIYMNKECMSILIDEFTKKITISENYLCYDNNKYGFQHALDLQLCKYIRALEEEDPSVYEPVLIYN